MKICTLLYRPHAALDDLNVVLMSYKLNKQVSQTRRLHAIIT
jgi:hypothetical protein